jgi:hypothetical protein
MIRVLKATQQQYEALNGYTYLANTLQFVKDGNNNWIVGKEVLHNGNFLEIRPQLLELTEIDYTPIETI